jgi:hypothetical protein
MVNLIKEHYILVGWFCFVVLTYLFAYLDYAYYRYNIKDKVMQIYEALTEEE